MMITYSQKSLYVAAAIKAARKQLELLYPSVGQSDRLFPFQGRLCAAGQELERLEKEISLNSRKLSTMRRWTIWKSAISLVLTRR